MVLHIIPTGDGKTHEVRRDGQALGAVEKRTTLDGIRWALAGKGGLLGEAVWLSRSGAAAGLASLYEARTTP